MPSTIESAPDSPASIANRRANQLLRYALDKFLRGDHDRVNEFDVHLFRATLSKLDAVPSPSASHVRLRSLVEGALAQYADMAGTLAAVDAVSETAAPGLRAPIEAAVAAGPAVAAAGLLDGGQRRPVYEVAGIVVDLMARVFERAGNVVLEGDVPEDALLVVREGGVTLRGMLLGHVWARDAIRVEGGVQGGIVLSTHGSIASDRILAGSRVIAPAGDIEAGLVDRASRVFAGGGVRVSGDVRGAKLYGARIEVQGRVRGAELHVVDTLTAAAFDADPRDPLLVSFREYLTPADFGRAHEAASLVRLRTLPRALFRVRAGKAMVALAHAESCQVLRAQLYLLGPPGPAGPGLDELRAAQCQQAFYALFADLARALVRMVYDAIELDPALARAIGIHAFEEIAAPVRAAERLLASAPDDLLRGCKEPLLGACRLLPGLARRIQDSAQRGGAPEEALAHLMRRIEEWDAAHAQHAQRLRGMQPRIEKALGPAAQPGLGPADLRKLLMVRTGQARRDPATLRLIEGGLARMLQGNLERAQETLDQWSRTAVTARAEWHGLREDLAGEQALCACAGPPEERYVRADAYGAGVTVAVSPAWGSCADADAGPALRIETPIGDRTTFHHDGVMVRRVPPRGETFLP